MRPSTFFYVLGQGIKGVFRNRVMTIASILVLIACMVLVGTLYLVIDTIDNNFRDIPNLRVIEIRLDKNYEEPTIKDIAGKLSDICHESEVVDWNKNQWTEDINIPRTEIFKFVSADEHLKKMFAEEPWMQNMFKSEDIEFFNANYDPKGIKAIMPDNPLRPSFFITFESFSDIDGVLSLLNRIDSITIPDPFDVGSADGSAVNPETDETTKPKIDAIITEDIINKVDFYQNVMSIKNVLSVASVWLMAIFLIISLFVIMNTIKLGVSARENEIKFMRLCGATKRFIRMPFMVEGIIIGVVSAVLALGIEFYLYEYMLKGIISSSIGTDIYTADFVQDYGFRFAVGFTAIGLFAGVIASRISMKKFLKA